jgi:hypothetical protein
MDLHRSLGQVLCIEPTEQMIHGFASALSEV